MKGLRQRVERGELAFDPLQAAAAARLEALARALERQPEPVVPAKGLLGWLAKPKEPPPAPRGIYIHGDVGRGKSMLMDLFYGAVGVTAKRRVHFHEFMLEVQRRLHGYRQGAGGVDPLRRLADEIAAAQRLLCFDEFHVVNIADAMILGRLFEGLILAGVTIVATSNWAPHRLYENGLNRDRFLPFIDLLQRHVDVLALDGPVDYRLTRLREVDVYRHPLGPDAAAWLERVLAALTDRAPTEPVVLEVGTRRLNVPRAAAGVAVFAFPELCATALGAADYLALTERFHALILADVPALTPDKRNEARRFMTLVDALYERRVMLLLSAAAPPEALYAAGDGAFEFQRTVSRLVEMQSRAYLEACRVRSMAALPDTFATFALTNDLI